MNLSSTDRRRRTLPCRAVRLLRRLSGDRRGQALAEFALVAPLLILLVMGVVELGRSLGVVHGMAGISREGALLASRGVALNDVISIVTANGSDFGFAGSGSVIVSRIEIRAGAPVIVDQRSSGSYASRLGALGEDAGGGLAASGFVTGGTVFAVEAFFDYRPITPLRNLIAGIIPDPLYERSVF